MQIIDGKQVASQVLEEVERDIARLREQGITPGLAVVLVEKVCGAGDEFP